MVGIVFWGPAGGIVSSALVYPYGVLMMVLAYIGGFLVFSLITGLTTHLKRSRDRARANKVRPTLTFLHRSKPVH